MSKSQQDQNQESEELEQSYDPNDIGWPMWLLGFLIVLGVVLAVVHFIK